MISYSWPGPERSDFLLLQQERKREALQPGTFIRVISNLSDLPPTHREAIRQGRRGIINACHDDELLPYEITIHEHLLRLEAKDVEILPPEQLTCAERRMLLQVIRYHSCPHHDGNASLVIDTDTESMPERDTNQHLQYFCSRCNLFFSLSRKGSIIDSRTSTQP